MNADIRRELDDHDKRLRRIEEKLFGSQNEAPLPEGFKGLSGGIRLLMAKQYLSEPRTLNEITSELKKEGYHYRIESVSKILNIDFTRNKKVLTRLKEGSVWKYVVRK